MEEIIILKWSAEQSGLRVTTNTPVIFKQGEKEQKEQIISWDDVGDMLINQFVTNATDKLIEELDIINNGESNK